MRYLRTNTAIRLTVGPFFDNTDGVTPETAITVTNEKLTFVVDDANVPTLVLDTAPTASGGANDMVHITGDDAGFYDLELAAANVNYLGRAMLSLTNAAVHCPVFHEFMILPANVYDSMILGTDALQVDASQWNGETIPTTNVTGVPKVDLSYIEGLSTGGNNATLNLKSINVTNDSGNAVLFQSTGNNGNGMVIQGHSFGYGLSLVGDESEALRLDTFSATAATINASGGDALALVSDSGDGLYIDANSNGINIDANSKSINAPQNIAVSDGDLTLAAIASAVWAAATRTLTAISDSSGITTLLSRIGGALNISGGKVESNVKQINGTNVTGDGSGTPWGPA